MGMYLTLRIFRHVSVEQLRAEFESAAICMGGRARWATSPATHIDECRMAHRGDTHSVYLPYRSGQDYRLCAAVGARLNCVWMELRIQEGSHWDFALYRGHQAITCFSALPEYWDADAARIAKWRGDPKALAVAWGVPVERIDRYLRPWGRKEVGDFTYETLITDKAYPEDRFAAGSYDQMWDFLAALGAADPMPATGEDSHSIQLPEPVYARPSTLRRLRRKTLNFLGPRYDAVEVTGDDGVSMITWRPRRFWWFG